MSGTPTHGEAEWLSAGASSTVPPLPDTSPQELGISPPSMAARYYSEPQTYAPPDDAAVDKVSADGAGPPETRHSFQSHRSSSDYKVKQAQLLPSEHSQSSLASQRSHTVGVPPLPSQSSYPSSGSQTTLATTMLPSVDNVNGVGSPLSSYPSGNVFTPTTPAVMTDEVIPTTFDEGMLRALCDMDCGMPLLYDRIKQSMSSAREAGTFFKKRAAIEEEYARSMSKLARSTSEGYSTSDGKAGSFLHSWQSMLRTHESIGDNRMRFASKLAEMSDELLNLAKEVDKNRKSTRETGMRLERNLQDAEQGVEKARARFDSTAEDLERLLLLKSGESARGGELQTGSGPGGKRTLGKAIGKSGLLFKNKNPQQILKQEEDIRARTSAASDAFRREVINTQGMRQEYFNLQLPRILRSLKESAEEIDNGTQYHLTRYAFLYESVVLGDGVAITPVGGTESNTSSGLKHSVDAIDNRADFKTYLQNYQIVHGRDYKGPKREGPYEEGFVPSQSGTFGKSSGTAASSGGSAMGKSSRPIFGVELATQMARDGVDIPPILEKCAAAIEEVGLQSMGIYRLSGTTSKVQKLKGKFDQDWSIVDLMNDEAINDINIIAGCLKLWFRELPEPLLTHELYRGFIDAAKIDNDRLRHIRLHEQVNELPDANYSTLKYLMGHLDRIRSEESINQMSVSNLAIVFGPTLLNAPPSGADANSATGPGGAPGSMGPARGVHLQDMSFQCRAIETILEKYREIFVDEAEEEG